MSVLEAQALGLPVITSDAYGVVDASVEGVTALRCGVNDPEGLYKAMKQYYDDANMRKAHGEVVESEWLSTSRTRWSARRGWRFIRKCWVNDNV